MYPKSSNYEIIIKKSITLNRNVRSSCENKHGATNNSPKLSNNEIYH